MNYPYTLCDCIAGALVSSLVSALLLSPWLAVQRKSGRRNVVTGVVLASPLLASYSAFPDTALYMFVAVVYAVSLVILARVGLERLHLLPPLLLALYNIVAGLENGCLGGR